MNKVIEWLLTDFNIEKIWAIIFIIGFLLLLKKEPFKIFTHFKEQKTKDADQAVALYKSDILGLDARKLIKEYIEKYFFKKHYGINTNSNKRLALLNLYEKHQDKLCWHNLKRAYPFMEFSGSKIMVMIKTRHHIERYVVSAVSWLLALFSLLVFILAITLTIVNESGVSDFFKMVSLSLIYLLPALMFSSLNFPYYSAIKIQKVLKEEDECYSQRDVSILTKGKDRKPNKQSKG